MLAARVPVAHRPAARLVAALAMITCSGGCTSAISTAYLRDAFWTAEDAIPPADESAADGEPAGDQAADAPLDTERRAAAIEEAVERLARLGTLDDATRATLVETLERTQQEDWPVVVEAFAASLESSGGLPRPEQPATDDAAPHVVAKAEVVAASTPPAPAAAPAPASEPVPDAAPEPAPEPATPPAPPVAAVATAAHVPPPPTAPPPPPTPSAPPAVDPPEPAPVPVPAPEPTRALAIGSACFASRVAGWGSVDRFPADRFHPGQEVIVYVELDHLAADVSPAGHTTCIDAALRLVDADGAVVHSWAFEPIAETCAKPRRDYFARYVVRMPETTPPGGYRVEVSVADTVAGATASTELPLEIAAAVSAR